jgi:hypothetical protein
LNVIADENAGSLQVDDPNRDVWRYPLGERSDVADQ